MAVPALLVVVAAALATVAVSLVVTAVEAERSTGARGPSRVAVATDGGTAPAFGPAGSASPSIPASAGHPPGGVPPQSPAGAALSSSAVAQAAPGCAPVRVAFGTGQAMPSPEVVARLRELGARLAAQPGATLVIDGHADSLGSDELNLRLSKRRAEALAWVLQGAGVDPTRITSRGFGAFSPMEGSAEDADANRRADIHVRGACPEGYTEVLGP